MRSDLSSWVLSLEYSGDLGVDSKGYQLRIWWIAILNLMHGLAISVLKRCMEREL